MSRTQHDCANAILPAVGVQAALGIVFLVAVGTFGCGSGSAGGDYAVAPTGLDLSGSWVFNIEQSDDPTEMMQQGGGGMGGGRGGGGVSGGGRSRGGRSGMRGGAPSEADQQRIQQTTPMATNPPRHMVLTQGDSTITLQFGADSPITLQTNWQKVRREIENGGQLDARVRWRRNTLEIEREIRLGGKVTQKITRSSTGDRLLVETQLELNRAQQPRIFHYVYDAASGEP